MAKKYTYSRTVNPTGRIDGSDGPETFTAVEFDSFDEAKKAVERGIADRLHEVRTKQAFSAGQQIGTNAPGNVTAGSTALNNRPPMTQNSSAPNA